MATRGEFGSATVGSKQYSSTAGTNLTYGGDVAYITDSAGNVVGLSKPDNTTLNIPFLGGYPSGRIKFASFGDSTADIGTINNVTSQDLRAATATLTPVALSIERVGSWIQFLSGGSSQVVFNGGVGGDTTTQVATRAVLASNIGLQTNKALIDAQTTGADFVFISMGINDFVSFTTATSAATISAAQATALANLKIVINKAKSLGLYCIVSAVLPYGTSPITANQAVVNAATATYNTQVQSFLSTCPTTAIYYDARTLAQGSDGGWNPLYSADGTHPNHDGAKRIYAGVISVVQNSFGISTYRVGLPKSTNLFSNADFSASTGGLATSVVIASVNGTTTNTIITQNGANAQSILWQPAAGTAVLTIDITLQAAATTGLLVGDQIACEYDVTVDDGSGNAPSVHQFNSYLMKTAGVGALIYAPNMSWFSGGPTNNFTSVISGKCTGGIITMDEAGSTSGLIKCRVNLTTATQPANVRLIMSNFRLVKLPAGY